jgi:PBP1b-binding outer membrane lipoprotein LpoB
MTKYLKIIIAILILSGCSEVVEDSANSQSPSMTAIVDGVAWNSTSSLSDTLAILWRNGTSNVISIGATNYKQGSNSEFIRLNINNCRSDSTFALAVINYGYLARRPMTSFITDSLHIGEVTITKFDTVNNVVAGTFSFAAKEEGGSTTIAVTNGKFNISFKKY